MRKINIELLSYSPKNLAETLSNQFTTTDYILNKRQFRYLVNYFASSENLAEPMTMVVESNYTSRSYLYDYSRYYSLCFQDGYKPINKRIHFFTSDFSMFSIDQFVEEIENKSSSLLSEECYLGYVVVKNIPKYVFGPTILRPYSANKNNKRFFPALRNYDIHLLGREYNIDSLVFQEQDMVVSACSTVSLWVAFHKTSVLFKTKLPTPSEITLMAKNFSGNLPTRTYPSTGLDLHQIVTVIDAVGLDFEIINNETYWDNFNRLKAYVHAYIYSGLPVLLGLDLDEKHLVTIVGFSDKCEHNGGSKRLVPRNWSKPRMKTDDINMFYIHCDQTGAFARLKLNSFEKKVELAIDDFNSQLKSGKVVSLTVPLYHKIRIKYDDIYNQIILLNRIFKKTVHRDQRSVLKWDIFLVLSERYKSYEFEKIDAFYEGLERKVRNHVLLTEFPRFIWVARLYYGEFVLMDIVFDTTGIANGFFCLDFFLFDAAFRENLSHHIEQNQSSIDALASINAEYPPLLKEAISSQL